MKKFFFCISLIVSISGFCQNDNPFELTHRIRSTKELVKGNEIISTNPFDMVRPNYTEPEVKETKPTTETNTVNKVATSENPFEISAASETINDPEKDLATEKLVTPIQNAPKQSRSKHSIKNDKKNLSLTTLGVLLFFTFLITLFRPELQRISKAVFSNNLTKSLAEVRADKFYLAYRISYLFFLFVASLFIYKITNYYEIIPVGMTFGKWLSICFLGTSAVFLTKHLTLTVLGYIYPIQKEINQYNYTLIFINILLGIGLIPIILLLLFGPDNLKSIVILGSFAAFILVYLFRIMKGIIIGSKYIFAHSFHFFMYLCTVEIAPILILIKFIKINTAL